MEQEAKIYEVEGAQLHFFHPQYIKCQEAKGQKIKICLTDVLFVMDRQHNLTGSG